MKDIFPPVEILLELQPEEVSEYLLIYLNKSLQEEPLSGRNKFHRYNETHPGNRSLQEYAGQHAIKVSEILSQAWVWLVVQGFLTPSVDENNDQWVMITERGQQVRSKDQFKQFSHIRLLSKDILDPKLTEKAWPIFIRGDFDTAIFSAFKEVEIRMRKAAKLSPKDVGVDLARKAFDPEKGALADIENPVKGEREAYAHLFAGVLGIFKNPSSHREVDYDDPVVATSLILLANTLLKIIDRRAVEYETREAEDLKLQASA